MNSYFNKQVIMVSIRAYFKKFPLGDNGAPRILHGGERGETTEGSGVMEYPLQKGGPGDHPRENLAYIYDDFSPTGTGNCVK